MAESVMRRLAVALLSMLMLAAAVQAFAHDNDPTRPPAAALPTAQDEEAVPAGPQLQSVLITYGTPPRKLAVIDGVTVKVGDKVGAATVQSISAREVILRTGRARQVLKMYDDGEAPASAAPAARVDRVRAKAADNTQDRTPERTQDRKQDKLQELQEKLLEKILEK